MAHVISDLSKYVIAIFMAVYALECFLVLLRKEENEKSGIFIRQVICMFMVHFLGFAAICLETGDPSYIIFYGFQEILLFATIALFRVVYPEADRLLVNNMCMMLAISFVVLTRISYDKSIRQFGIVAVSLIIGLFVPGLIKRVALVPYLTWVYGALGVVALTVVFILGSVTNGSNISYTAGGITFQPSEFVKILFVFFIAGMMATATDFKQVFLSAVCAGLHVLILVLSRDLGSAVIFFVVYLGMIFIATHNYFYLFAGLIAGAGASVIGYRLFSHVRVRVTAWLDPWRNIDNAGYQVTQSLFAIGTGGWFGMGVYQGNPSSIPYVEKDSVFSAVAEEMGVLFAIFMILVCLSSFLVCMKLAARLEEAFYRYVAVGLGITYIFQVFLTIGGGTRLIPLTGVTLPLVSYGGSSVLSTILLFSTIQGLCGIRRQERDYYEDDAYDYEEEE
ncbi:MAG: FtsW/RodA/SpoVE family cell cycle protein [Lachnospiraceae bacterium]|nr:FtsW/RodA/SpoVE family cell cycle protein [Lachnospiraceae bacterium]